MEKRERREKRKNPLLIVVTKFCLKRPRAAHALHSDLLITL